MSTDSAGSIAVLAEKPSVARDIAKVLGANTKGDNYLHGNGYVVTWAVGHLASLAQPHEINPSWRSWRRDTLPMLPQDWPLVVYDKTKDQFETVRRILNSPKISRVICATDAGREGELIFRYIYEAANCQKPVDRLWISSLTPDAIRKGFDNIKPAGDYDGLADAARGRSRADWLVGMNLSRAYTLAFGEELSVGRVQTPTLAMLVERELAVRAFVPEDYKEVIATFRPKLTPQDGGYKGTWFRPQTADGADKESVQKSMRLPADGKEAKEIVARAKVGDAKVESIKRETQRLVPPFLYDLTELQRHANRLFGFTAQKTLDLAQALYEQHKLISYPRTDSRHLSKDVAATLPGVVKQLQPAYGKWFADGTGERPLGRRYIDDAKVSDHHAIIPTNTSPARANLSTDEGKIYDLVCRRLLSAWHEDHQFAVTTVITLISTMGFEDRFQSSGTEILKAGWKILDFQADKKSKKKEGVDADAGEQVLPPTLYEGQSQEVVEVDAVSKKTRAPRRFTEGTLLTAMETAGKTLDEKELSDAMKESGLGTPATRASIIEVLLKREYIFREAKSLMATEKGIHLIEVVHPEVKSPAMTGQWEAYLKRIEKGGAELGLFLKGIEEYVTDVVGKVGNNPSRVQPSKVHSVNQIAPSVRVATETKQPANYESIEELLTQGFGFPSFRANQELVCRTIIEGKDALLVMPTGAGKSLCYQLPGVARGGTTLVISPLIALMEDQVAKLASRGFAVDRIHSGRDRGASRQACIDYLNGKLQFLFIAPERLRVSGFPEMLAKRKPSLIAIDEAHCISQWGHDFRPDYRMFGQHLPSLRPAPVIALTATATAVVQKDIAAQLGLDDASRFIHGFRRENLAIEVVEVPPGDRPRFVAELLSDEDRLPAIVYAPTRKQVEQLSAQLAEVTAAAGYHAGLDSARRKSVQERFLNGELKVMVATIAFGMGIDKADIRTVIHTALPGSLEGYYQEIGRAGRDGGLSRAVLMHSYADRYTHDFFFERDYPDVRILDQIYGLLTEEAQPKEQLQRRGRMDSDLFDKALEKLWIHGGAVLDYAENCIKGQASWRNSYVSHGEQRKEQIAGMLRFAETDQCRMSALVRHFGDLSDSRKPCGICDFCAPETCEAQKFRPATKLERRAFDKAVKMLGDQPGKSTGRLHTDLFPNGEMTRDEFEQVLGAMARLGYITLTEAVFEKDGKQIPYRKASLTRAAGHLDETSEVDLLVKTVSAQPSKRGKGKKTVGKGKKRVAGSADPAIEKKLRAWRLAEAKRKKVPAFRILTDASLIALAEHRPSSVEQLLNIPGIGKSTAEKHGAQLMKLVR